MRAFGYVVALVCLLLAGCSTSKGPRENLDSAQATNFWQPHFLYILDSPCPKMRVEIDAVKGCEPPEATLRKLRDFFQTYCRKPDGIEMVRGAVISRAAARGVSPDTLACRYLQGPPSNSPAPTAFLQILFYDSDLTDNPPMAGVIHPGMNPLRNRRWPARKPMTQTLPYPAVIFMNTGYFFKSAHEEMILHEAGHALGLVSRTNNAWDHHCSDPRCLMYKTANAEIHLSRLLWDPLHALTIEQKKFCPRCLAELTNDAKLSPPQNLRFAGPVMVRSEAGYHVLSLPSRMTIIVGDLTPQDCADFAKAGTTSMADDVSVVTFKQDLIDHPAQLSEICRRTGADPYDRVRHTMADACVNHRQFADAVAICRQSMRSDPKDAWICNQLAWIEATCPDASVRNAQEAIDCAAKACEISQWRDWSLIDTLAAAWAEKGDFKQALAFEKQALRTSFSNAPDYLEMRGRLLLYEQSKPFREAP